MGNLSRYFYKTLFFLVQSLIDLTIYIRKRLWKYNLDEHDIIDSSIPTDNIYVRSDNGSVFVAASHIKKRYKVYRITLENKITLDCADNHLICVGFGYIKQAKDLKVGEPVSTINGSSRVFKVEELGYSSFMFDLTIANQDQLYYTNNILSHNSIITAIFITWYLLFNYDRNVMCVSQNKDKVTELGDKITVVIKNLPFYLKPGIVTNNVMTKVFDSGCKLVLQTTTENTGASFTIHLLYADEFALVSPQFIREFYRTIFPTLSSSKISRMIITSTPRGLNKFYEIYRDAIESKNNFNPIRVDWYEVEGHDEKWKNDQILDLGSEDDFNQEFGNQFLAGNTLLFKTEILKKLKRHQIKFVHQHLEEFSDRTIDYEGLISWHPKFDMANLKNEACRYLLSLDLGDGNGGDFTAIPIFQILPMSKEEIDLMKIFSEEKDFFKLVQVGLFRSNRVPLPELAILFYHLVIDVMIQENVKAVLEMNHEGNYFRSMVESLYGDDNQIEEEHLFVRFKYNMKDEASQATRVGLTRNEGLNDHGTKVIKDKIKYNQIVMLEYMTVEEALSFAKNKSGQYESQTGNDDCVAACINITHYLSTVDYAEQIDELMQFVPKGFLKEINAKLNKPDIDEDDDDDLADLLM